ncbi:MAG TPA: 2-succinyl-6-hydroxy-2,4-cyclohexadiene-1-carboxylate synthase [Polyangiaceae bacterium]|nr:2-succinyl-6-hydroxy-2,4-cyclohexadiene-1-carboxylate synthase [Polyangiaceae bacterium]
MTIAVALLHGFTGSPSSFQELAAVLEPRGVRVAAPPLLGHGADDSGVRDFEGEVERLARGLAARDRPMHLLGYSLGGRVAIGLLCRHPELFSSATLVSTQPGLSLAQARLERRVADEAWCDLLLSQGIAAFVQAWENLPLFATQANLSDDVLARQRAERLAHDAGGLVRSLKICGLGEMPSYWQELAAVRIPTTIVAGERDAKFVVIAQQMREKIRGASLVVVPGAGHNLVLERPAALAGIVMRTVLGGER